jgi:hypothetical protein
MTTLGAAGGIKTVWVIVEAGPTGLGLRLARSGLNVTVVEKQGMPWVISAATRSISNHSPWSAKGVLDRDVALGVPDVPDAREEVGPLRAGELTIQIGQASRDAFDSDLPRSARRTRPADSSFSRARSDGKGMSNPLTYARTPRGRGSARRGRDASSVPTRARAGSRYDCNPCTPIRSNMPSA